MSKSSLETLADKISKELKLEGLQVAGSSKGLDIKRVSTGSLSYDISVGGGIPIGRSLCIMGPESCGKTTIALMVLAKYFETEDTRPALFLDSEHAFDKVYAKSLGVNLDRLFIYQPDSLEDGDIMLKKLVNENAIGAFAIDSIASLVPQSVLENPASSSNIGVHARSLGNIFKALNPVIAKNDILGIWLNQIRDNIGGYGNPHTTPGGWAPKFYSSIMIQLNRGSKIDNGDGTFSNKGKLKVTKNKTFPPYKEAEYIMNHGTGIDTSLEVMDYGVQCGVLYKKGHSFYYDETFENDEEKRKDHVLIGKGKADAKNFLDDNVDLRDLLYETILKTYLSNE